MLDGLDEAAAEWKTVLRLLERFLREEAEAHRVLLATRPSALDLDDWRRDAKGRRGGGGSEELLLTPAKLREWGLDPVLEVEEFGEAQLRNLCEQRLAQAGSEVAAASRLPEIQEEVSPSVPLTS